MVDIIAENALRDQLGATQGRLATIRDSQGRLLGYFVPVSVHEDELFSEALAYAEPQELARRARDPGPRRTTQEVLERLKGMEKPMPSRSC